MNDSAAAFTELYNIVKRLRSPTGCPWDREQDPRSLRGNLIEEAFECVEAIDEQNPEHIKEEIGDVFLLATMLGYMHEQGGVFTVADSLKTISAKLVRRHPHVFGVSDATNSEAVIKQWDRIKVEQEGRTAKDSVLDKVSRALPPLERAGKLQNQAAKLGFDWPKVEGVWDKISEELSEAKAAYTDYQSGASETRQAALEGELGDLLFAVINLCRYLNIDPAVALHGTNQRFSQRFKFVEKRMKDSGQPMERGNLDLMDLYWNEAKEPRQ